MTKVSAGLLVFRRAPAGPEFLLAHPGGPFWARRDEGAWSIPKGLLEPDEPPLDGAFREFGEELGLTVSGAAIALTPRRQPGGKLVMAWLVEADLDLAGFRPGLFEMPWPPRSGRLQQFPEVDAVRYMAPAEARVRILAGQRPFLEEALTLLDGAAPD